MTQVSDEHGGQAGHHDRLFKLRIDREHFEVAEPTITGQQLRNLPNPPIGDDRDLYQEIPGGEDKLIGKTDVATLNQHDLTIFFTSPAEVTPGA